MKKKCHRWINGTKGAISLLLAILMLPFFSLAAVIVELGRYQSTLRMLDEVFGINMVSVMANYDSYVKDQYGLLATSQETELNDEMMRYWESMGLSELNQVNLDALSTDGLYPLSDVEMLRRQVSEISKLVVPTKLGMEALNLEDLVSSLEELISFKGVLDLLQKGCDTAEKTIDTVEKLEGFQKKVQSASDAINQYIPTYQALRDSIGTMENAINDYDSFPDSEQAAAMTPEEYNQALQQKEDAKRAAISAVESNCAAYKSAIEKIMEEVSSIDDTLQELNDTFQELGESITSFGGELAGQSIPEENKDFFENCLDTNTKVQQAAGESIKNCQNAFNKALIDQATERLQKDLDGVNQLAAKGTESWTVGDIDSCHTSDISGLVQADAISAVMDEFNKSVETEFLDYIGAMLDIFNELFAIKTLYDPELNNTLDLSYYETQVGGLVSKRDTVYTPPEFTAGDEALSQEYLAQINGAGGSSGVDNAGVMSMDSMQQAIDALGSLGQACADARNSIVEGMNLIKLMKAFKDALSAVGKLLQSIGGIIMQMIQAISNLAQTVYKRISVSGYLVYNLPNRTTYKDGSPLFADDFGKPDRPTTGEDLWNKLESSSSLLQIGSAINGMGNANLEKQFDGAELEYILWGNSSEVANQAMTFALLMFMRCLMNAIPMLSTPEYTKIATNPVGIVIFVVIWLAESILDAVLLVNGKTVALIKLDPYLSVDGIDNLIEKLVDGIPGMEGLADTMRNGKAAMQANAGTSAGASAGTSDPSPAASGTAAQTGFASQNQQVPNAAYFAPPQNTPQAISMQWGKPAGGTNNMQLMTRTDKTLSLMETPDEAPDAAVQKVVNLDKSTPEPTQTPKATQKPVDLDKSTPEPTQTPKATQKPVDLDKSTPEPTQTPKATQKPVDLNKSTPEPTQTPKPTRTPKPDSDSTPKPERTPKPDADSTPKPERTPKPDADSTPKPERTSKPDTDSTPKPQRTPKPDADSTPKPQRTPKPDTDSTPKPDQTQKPGDSTTDGDGKDDGLLTDHLKKMNELNYSEYLLLYLLIFNSDTSIERLGDLIECNATVHYGTFDLDKSYTVLRTKAEGTVDAIFPIPQFAENSAVDFNRILYRGY